MPRPHAAFALLFLACSPPYHVIRNAPENPLAHATAVVIEPLRFDHLSIGGDSESAYNASKGPEELEIWQEVKRDMSGRFMGWAIAAARPVEVRTAGSTASPVAVVVRTSCDVINPGALGSGATFARASAQVVGPGGKVFDELYVEDTVSNGQFNTAGSLATHVRRLGERLGEHVGRFIRDRASHK
jgi:hypothetical protein